MINTELPLDEKDLKDITGNGTVEYCMFNQRSKSGMPTWELKIKNPDNTRKVVIVRDFGFAIRHEIVEIKTFNTITERNKEILRLYKEEGLSQIFLGNLFNISQPSVSLIVNGK